jgi:NAD-dependent SIR2 family protein deacetylase
MFPVRIPDFRSKKTGLYNSLDCSKIGIPSPELLFDIEYFNMDPAPFYKYAACLLPNEGIKPSDCHRFISLLESKQKLLRVYTQNVDGLERKAGVSKVVECHGSMAEFQCTSCKKRRPLDESIRQTIQKGKVCECGNCKHGILKPCVIFFGENIANSFEKIVKKDVEACDLVIVVGTSLKVGGSVNELLKQMPVTTKKVLINKDIVSSDTAAFKIAFDAALLGDCNCIVQYICSQLGWGLNFAARPHVDHGLTEADAVETKSSIILKMGTRHVRTVNKCRPPPRLPDGFTRPLKVNAAQLDGQMGLSHLKSALDHIENLVQFTGDIVDSREALPTNYFSCVSDITADTVGLIEAIIPLAILLNGVDDLSECEYDSYPVASGCDDSAATVAADAESKEDVESWIRFVDRNAWIHSTSGSGRNTFLIAYEGEEDKLAGSARVASESTRPHEKQKLLHAPIKGAGGNGGNRMRGKKTVST